MSVGGGRAISAAAKLEPSGASGGMMETDEMTGVCPSLSVATGSFWEVRVEVFSWIVYRMSSELK